MSPADLFAHGLSGMALVFVVVIVLWTVLWITEMLACAASVLYRKWRRS